MPCLCESRFAGKQGTLLDLSPKERKTATLQGPRLHVNGMERQRKRKEYKMLCWVSVKYTTGTLRKMIGWKKQKNIETSKRKKNHQKIKKLTKIQDKTSNKAKNK